MNKGVLCKYAPLGRDVLPIISMRRYCAWIQVSVPQLQSKMRSTAECCTNDACQPLASMRMRHPSHSFTAPSLHPLSRLAKKYFVRTKQETLSKNLTTIYSVCSTPKGYQTVAARSLQEVPKGLSAGGGGGDWASNYNREITSCLTLEDAWGLPGL